MTLSDQFAAIDSERQHGNQSSANRIAQGDFDLVLPGLGRKDRQPACVIRDLASPLHGADVLRLDPWLRDVGRTFPPECFATARL
jgi:hypothetical protein